MAIILFLVTALQLVPVLTGKDRLKEINLPTLVIHGTEDAILPFDHGQALADGIPNAKLMVLEGVGHEIPEQMTEEITSRMIEHFNSI